MILFYGSHFILLIEILKVSQQIQTMNKNLQNEGKSFTYFHKQTASSSFYSNRRTHRQYYSMKKNHSVFSQTTYTSPSPSPSPQKQKQATSKRASLSPERKYVYWQNWLLPEGIRKQVFEEQPIINSNAMCAIFTDNNEIFLSQNSYEKRQIASLTKIMTAFTVINICNSYGVKIRETWIKIQKQASLMEGTSANLRNDDQLLVIDLLYGLMLPSGNDAGIALAQYFGKFMSYTYAHENVLNFTENQEGVQKFAAQKQYYDTEYKDQSIKLFVFQMNKNAQKMKLKRTHFSNPTGLTDHQNYSTAQDIANLICFCMKNHLMRNIFKKKIYTCEARNEKLAASRQIEWRNTNKHLFNIRDCIGVKTGITPGAGPCLSTAYRVMGRELIIVLLNSKSLEDRYVDAEKIFKYTRNMLQRQQHQNF